MAKLTNKDRESLRYALRCIERGIDYIMRPDVHVARECSLGSTDIFHRELDSVRIASVTKEYGSDLVGLMSGRDALSQFLATH